MKLLLDHDWRGNVRELKNAVERSMIFCDRETSSVLLQVDGAYQGGSKAFIIAATSRYRVVLAGSRSIRDHKGGGI